MTESHRSVIARIKPILDAADIQYARSYPSMVRRMRNWSGGVVVEKRLYPVLSYKLDCPSRFGDAGASVVSAAVRACRAAGWTVDDDGTIRALPPKSVRTKSGPTERDA